MPYFYAVRRLALPVVLRAACTPAVVAHVWLARFPRLHLLKGSCITQSMPDGPSPRLPLSDILPGAAAAPRPARRPRLPPQVRQGLGQVLRHRQVRGGGVRGRGRGSTECQGKAASCLCGTENGAAVAAARLGHALRRWSGGVQLLTGQSWLAHSFLPAGTACSHSSIELPLQPSSLGTPALLLLAWPLLPSACRCRLPLPASPPPALLVFRRHTTYRCCNTSHHSLVVWMRLWQPGAAGAAVHCKAVLQPGFAT